MISNFRSCSSQKHSRYICDTFGCQQILYIVTVGYEWYEISYIIHLRQTTIKYFNFSSLWERKCRVNVGMAGLSMMVLRSDMRELGRFTQKQSAITQVLGYGFPGAHGNPVSISDQVTLAAPADYDWYTAGSDPARDLFNQSINQSIN